MVLMTIADAVDSFAIDLANFERANVGGTCYGNL